MTFRLEDRDQSDWSLYTEIADFPNLIFVDFYVKTCEICLPLYYGLSHSVHLFGSFFQLLNAFMAQEKTYLNSALVMKNSSRSNGFALVSYNLNEGGQLFFQLRLA